MLKGIVRINPIEINGSDTRTSRKNAKKIKPIVCTIIKLIE